MISMKVVAGLLFDEEKFLIGQRLDENSSYGGYWELPGGKIDEGETSYDAIIREWKEELDIDVEAYYEIPNREINGIDTYPFLLRFKSGKPFFASDTFTTPSYLITLTHQTRVDNFCVNCITKWTVHFLVH